MAALVLGLCAALPTAAARAQEVRERAAVRAGTVAVAIESRSGAFRLQGRSRFSVDDFDLSVDGERATLLSVDESLEEAAAGRWQLLIYVDTALSSNRLVRSATGLLAEAAPELVTLGEVEIVVADPDPGLLLASTEDAARIRETLAGLAVGSLGDDLLMAQRRELSDLIERPAELLERAAAREAAIVRRQSDRLLTWLTSSDGTSPRRALLLVSGGFDVDPEAYYRGLLARAETPGDDEATRAVMSAALSPEQEELARAIAAGGWITFSFRLPEPDPLPRRWGLIRSLLVRADGNWDPQRAEVFFELGESLIAQRKWKAAEEALRDASYHFHGQPKLRPRQAQALLRLAWVLEQQDRRDEAETVARKAVHLDPTVASGVNLVGLLDPLAPLALLADATSGGLVWDLTGLREVLAGLSQRLLLTYQADGRAPAEPAEVAVAYDAAGHEVLAARWAPGTSPASIARARSRRLLDNDLEVAIAETQRLEPAVLDSTCTMIDSDDVERRARLSVAVDPDLGEAWEGTQARLRVTASSWVDDTIRTVSVTGPEETWHPGRILLVTTDLETTPGDAEIALVIEEMETARWLTLFLECEELEPGLAPGR